MTQHKEAPPAPGNLGSHALRGGRVLAVGTVAERLARLGRNMLLARWIAPDQFGIMAITLAVIALFEAITEVGVSQAVIQNKRGNTPEFLNVAWWFGVVRGVVVALLAVPLAAPIAGFYDEPDLTPLLMVAPLTVVFTGLTSPRVYALQRQFKFKATLFTFQGAGLIGTAFTIVLGLVLQNVWALLWGAVFEAFVRFVISFVLCPIKPGFRLDRESRRDLFKFTKGMAGLSLLTFLIMQADTFVLGKVVTSRELGLYTMAIALAAFPLSIFSKVVRPLVVPILAHFQEDFAGMRTQVLGLSRLVWLFGLPLTTVMACVAGPLLVLVYGRPDWEEAGPAFAIYSLFAIFYMASMVTFGVYLAIGRPELQRRFTIVRAVLVILALYPMSVWLGLEGAALALLIAMALAMVVQLFNLRRVIDLSVLSYLGTLRAGLVSSALVAIPCLAMVWFTPAPGWVDVLVCAALGGFTWGVLLLRERRTLTTLRRAAKAGQHPVDPKAEDPL